MISTRTHGILDYVIGALLIIAPCLLGFADGGAAMWTPILIGAAIIASALFTKYELGVVRALPMRVHLGLDIVLGIFLALSPWLLGFSELVWAPHLIVGLIVLGSGMMTHKTSPLEQATIRHP